METARETPARRPFHFTRDAYYRLGELGLFKGHRVELIQGSIVERSPMGIGHWHAMRTLYRCLIGLTQMEVLSQLPIALEDDSEPEPDFVIADAAACTDKLVDAKLVIEVSDSTLKDDLGKKAQLYAANGIPEYWVIDLGAKETVVHRSPEESKYTSIHRAPWANPVTSSAVPGLTVTLSDVLGDWLG